MSYLTRSLTGSTPAPPPLDPNTWGMRWGSAGGIVFEAFAQQKVTPAASDIMIAPPAGTAEGDLLIAAVATDGDQSASLAATTGWNLLVVDYRWNAVTFGVWWRIASASEPGGYKFSWSGSEDAYGWVSRFTGHDPVNPINDWAVLTTGSGVTLTPPSPAVTTTVNDAMILRLGGFDDGDITIGFPGLPGHTAINMDKSGNGVNSASGGSGYVIQAAAGDSGQSTFTLTDMEQTVAVTVAIAPDPS